MLRTIGYPLAKCWRFKIENQSSAHVQAHATMLHDVAKREQHHDAARVKRMRKSVLVN